MAYQHRELTEAELGPAAWKMAGPDAPPPMRAMAARGLAPLPPRDLVVALYHFWASNEPTLGEEATKTVLGLPAAILGGAFEDPSLPAGVLDFLGRKYPRNEDILEKVVRHPQVHDETLAGVARLCPESICDILAENQTRWMGFPAIVEALYENPNCRMSVAHRMLELAVRQGIDVRLPNIDEIKAALGDGTPPSAEEDATFAAVVGGEVAQTHHRMVEQVARAGSTDDVDYNALRDAVGVDEGLDIDALLATAVSDDLELPMEGEQPAPQPEESAAPEESSSPEEPSVKGDRVTEISRLPTMQKVRLALLGNTFERSVLIRDSNKAVCMSAIKSPRVRENEVVAYSANRVLSHDVVRYIARRRDWVKLYQVKYNLIVNPKTPLAAAMGFLGHLHRHDLRKVARSRNIPSALAQAAKRKEARGR